MRRWDRWKNTKQHTAKGLPLRYANREMQGSPQLPESTGRANDYNLQLLALVARVGDSQQPCGRSQNAAYFTLIFLKNTVQVTVWEFVCVHVKMRCPMTAMVEWLKRDV